MRLINRPLFTKEFNDPNLFNPEPGATYVYGVSSEERSEFAMTLALRRADLVFVQLRETEKFSFETNFPGHSQVHVRQRNSLENFVAAMSGGPIYLDFTGLGHNTWAPLVKVCLEAGRCLRAVYLEPVSYALSTSPRIGDIYDLSERIEGIEPIPLFTKLDEPNEESTSFIPLLGFEGTRLSHMLEEIQPPERKTFPVIGVPGFRPEYPFDAYLGNSGPLARTGAYRNVWYAKSNCPFSLFYTLTDISRLNFADHLKVGLIGTKPHALGAVLFAMNYASVELVYDHVKRKDKRTSGAAKCLVYGLSEFLPLNQILGAP